MNVRILPGQLSGEVVAPSSKSEAHRLLICAAFAPGTTDVACTTTSDDIDATIRCLEALGARIERAGDVLEVHPAPQSRETGLLSARRGAVLDCGESGSTLRFLLPVACALGAEATFTGAARLGARPLDDLARELVAGGCVLEGLGGFPLVARDRLRPGRFVLPGNVSSQYVSGLLLAAPLLTAPSEVVVPGHLESRP